MAKSFAFASDPLDSTEVQRVLEKHSIQRFYLDRIMEAIRHICIGHNIRSGYTVKSVSMAFPLNGAFTFVRTSDKKQFALRIANGKWVCK